MDHVYQAIASLIQNAENVGLMLLALFLFAGNVFQAWLHIIWRKEERKDRLDMVDTLRTVQTSIETSRTSVVDGLHSIQNTISAWTGRPM